MTVVILSLSTTLQFIAAFLSIRLIFVTGKWKAWALIAAAMTLMGVRRTITLYHVFTDGTGHFSNLTTELVALIISILMLIGVWLIGPIFKQIQTTNKKLALSERRWRLSVNGGGIASWEYNFQTRDNLVSKQMIDLLGVSELVPHEGFYHFNDWAERMHPNSIPKTMEAFNAVLEGKTSKYSVEQQVRREDGSYIWVLSRGMLVSRSTDGSPLLMIGTSEDISERKLSEELLQKNEEKYRNLFESAEVSIWNEDLSEVINVLDQLRKNGVTDLQQYLKDTPSIIIDIAAKVHVFQVNAATLKLFGAKDKGDFLYQIHKTFGPNAIEVFISELCAIWNGETSFRSEVELKRLDGSIFSAIISFKIPDNAESFKSLPVSIIDITDRKIIEEKLKLSAKVFNELNEGISITNTQGIIIDVNPAFCEITGYCRDEIIGQNSSKLNSGKQSPAFYTKMWKTLNKQGYWQGEVWNRKKSGELYAELLSISPIFDDDKNISHYVGIAYSYDHEHPFLSS